MRAGLLVVLALVVALFVALFVASGCSPRSDLPRTPDDDLDVATPAPARSDPAPLPDEARAVAPPGKGLRTGTIARPRLIAVLDAGPASLLRQIEVAPQLSGNQFVGWQLVQLLDRTGPLGDVDLVPGDVLLAINGKPLSRPEQLQTVWDSLRTANAVVARMWRGDQKLELHFAIDPPVP